jgi:hypothetical protein
MIKRTGLLMTFTLVLLFSLPQRSQAKIIVGLSSVNVAFLPVYVTEAC